MLRASVLTLVMVLAVAACAAPVQQAETGTAATAAATTATTTLEPAAPPVSAAGAIWPPRMPAAGNFEEVPLGKWADYEETYLDAATIRERVALVSREAEVITIET